MVAASETSQTTPPPGGGTYRRRRSASRAATAAGCRRWASRAARCDRRTTAAACGARRAPGSQGHGDVGGGADGVAEGRGVLDRLAGALTEAGQHRMGGVADQADPARRPAPERRPVVLATGGRSPAPASRRSARGSARARSGNDAPSPPSPRPVTRPHAHRCARSPTSTPGCRRAWRRRRGSPDPRTRRGGVDRPATGRAARCPATPCSRSSGEARPPPAPSAPASGGRQHQRRGRRARCSRRPG